MYPNSESQHISNRTVVMCLFTVILVIALLYLPKAILGYRTVSLATAKPYAGLIAQYLTTAEGSTKLPIEGVDFKLQTPVSFDGGDWQLIHFTGTKNGLGDGNVLLKKVDGNYVVALGPSGVFSANDTIALPAEVAVYLSNKGLIYNAN